MYVPKPGDFVWLDFDLQTGREQTGREQAGRRPALVLANRRFHLGTSVAYVCPIASKVKGYATEAVVRLGLPVHGAVLSEHMRSLDWRARQVVFIDKCPAEVLEEVRELVGTIAGVTP